VYVPFEPMAEAVNEYFRLFTVVYRGNIGATARHIAHSGPYYIDWDSEETKAQIKQFAYRGYLLKKPPALKPKDGRYYPDSQQLSTMFTNAMYIGHWVIKGKIARRDNHAPIVPVETFMAAFN